MKIDLNRSDRTVREQVWFIKSLLETIDKPPERVGEEDVRFWLGGLNGYSNAYKANAVKALRRFFRDFLGRPEVVASFKLPGSEFKLKKLPSKAELRAFYRALDSARDKALFLLFASSGLRRCEVLSLTRKDIDLAKRTVKPSLGSTSTKRRWVSFFNEEAKRALKAYLAGRRDDNPKLFPMRTKEKNNLWRGAKAKTGLAITPGALRAWFCSEMARLGVPSEYIDAFCGRVPRSILARHYLDYSPERLKAIYDKAGLKVLR